MEPEDNDTNTKENDDISIKNELLSIEKEHYLKRELLKRQISNEVELLNDFRNIGIFGPPFDSHNSTVVNNGYHDFPILRHMFVRYVLTFPFIADVDQKRFWTDKVQPFIESFSDRDISDSADRSEETKRKRIGRKLQKLILMYSSSAFQTTRKAERDVEVETEQSIKKAGRQDIDVNKLIGETAGGHYVNGYDVTVEGVRQITIKRGFFSTDTKVWQFIVRAQIQGAPEVRVARSFKEFKELDNYLQREYAAKRLPKLPAKHKSALKLQTPEQIMKSANEPNTSGSNTNEPNTNVDEKEPEEDENSDTEEDYEEDDLSKNEIEDMTMKPRNLSLFLGIKKKKNQTRIKIQREKQRITFRSYLRRLLEIKQITHDSVFLEFLFKDRLQKLSQDELDDISIRKRLDLARIEDQLKFLEIAKERARKLEKYVAEFKSDLRNGDQFKNMFNELKDKENIQQLSPRMQRFLEWATVEISATLYQLFVGGDDSPEFYSQVRRIHEMMPYTVLRGILRYSNPMAIMKGMTDLFLTVSPFSKRSLLQSIFMMILSDDSKAQDKAIKQMATKIDEHMCKTIEEYVYSAPEIRRAIQNYSENHGHMDIIMSIFEAYDTTQLNPNQKQFILATVRDWYKDWSLTVDDVDAQVDVVKVTEYSRLKEYLLANTRKRDKDQMQEFWADESTLNLIKELVSVFYGPLVKIFKIANMPRALSDFEHFMDDLIKIVDKYSVLAGSAIDANQSVEEFISLSQRHQSSVFRFIHEVYANDKQGLFERLIEWISNIMNSLQTGIGAELDIMEIIQSNDQIDQAKVFKELDEMVDWAHKRRKIRLEMIKDSSNEEQELWQEARPYTGLDMADFGMLNEDEEDSEEERGQEENDTIEREEGDNLIEQERKYRQKLAIRQELQKKLPEMPVISEIPKLVGNFRDKLENIVVMDDQQHYQELKTTS